MERLRKIIEKVGFWKKTGNIIDFELDIPGRYNNINNVLYAFICDSELLYIGETTKGLSHRLRQYKNAHESQRTNLNIKRKIKDLLDDGKTVDIYAFFDDKKYQYGGFRLNLAAGLEDNMISELNPPWNQI